MDWEDGELAKVSFGWRKKKPKKRSWTLTFVDKWIPVPYVRLVHQFTLEAKHGMANDGHEAVRRMNYAQRMLEAFGRELEGYRGTKEKFRSKVLTPVLQRQLRGIPDTYAPPLRAHMCSSDDEVVTLSEATKFYLKYDPLSPRCIPSYRRNLLYIREARWHLMVLLKKIKVTSTKDFNWGLRHHTAILRGMLKPIHKVVEDEEEEPSPVPRLNYAEVKAIILEGLEEFFHLELARVVCTRALPHP